MNLASSAVPYQVFNPLAAVARPAPPQPNPAAPAPATHLLRLLPQAGKPLFIGTFRSDIVQQYVEYHRPATASQFEWDNDAATCASDHDLIVISHIDCSPEVRERLAGLKLASAPTAQLFVCEQSGPHTVDPVFELLMDSGWMPDLLQAGGAGDHHVIQAIKTFESADQDDMANAGFLVVVAGPPGHSGAAAALESPGLTEVNAQVCIADGGQSAAHALAAALEAAAEDECDADWILLCQPQAWFPAGFGKRLNRLLADIAPEERERSLIGFIGIGVDKAGQGFAPAGFVVEGLRRESHRESFAAVSIDELAIVVSRQSLHQIDPAMGWQFWATDLCLAAICSHQIFPRIARMPIMHRRHDRQPDRGAIHHSAALLLDKYPAFGPVPTLNGTVDAAFVERHQSAEGDSTRSMPATPSPVQQVESPRPSLEVNSQQPSHDAPLSAHAGEAPITCAICNQAVEKWSPHPQIGLRSEFMKLLDTVGSDLSVYQCPHCHSNDRDRHLWHYMRAVGLLKILPSAQILHIAPERPLEMLIEAHKPAAYVRGDLQPRRADHLKLDVEALPFDDGSFDLVICNHVLEHVADPARALAEFHRCLVPGGVLIAQTPFAPALKNTLELNRPVSPGFARLFYGQEDHVRLFGADIVDLFHGAGFAGELLSHSDVLGEMDARRHGCNAREPFFAFTK